MVLSRNLILNTCEDSELTLNCYIELMCIINNLLCKSDILIIREV